MIEFNEKPLKAILKKGTSSVSFFIRSVNRTLTKNNSNEESWLKSVFLFIVTDESDIDKIKEYFEEWSSVDTIEILARKYQDKEFVYNTMMTIPGPFTLYQISSNYNGYDDKEFDIMYTIVYQSE